VYETPPWGPVEQPNFLNAIVVVNVQDSVEPITLLRSLQQIEAAHGRTRDIHWGPRTLDIDIIVLGSAVSSLPELILPHPRAQEREFVLVPWVEIDPNAELPGVGKVRDLLGSLDPSLIKKVPDVTLV
jgi:2-amino-4-hydroxy-6-hydroxymethyldihydropteridine diphosphokinase